MEKFSQRKHESHFSHQPSFAELWEMCVYEFLYNEKAYCNDMERLLSESGITRDSRILDLSAGGGFPALGLLEKGYRVESADGFADEVELYNTRAKERGIESSCTEVMWADLPSRFEQRSYDMILCRGNSFVYAAGGWNQEATIEPETALDEYTAAARIFASLLKPDGLLYIDKFKDSESSHKETVAKIRIGQGESEELIFWTERLPEKKTRRASMLRKKADGTETGTPNISYDLTFPELVTVLEKAGFDSISPTNLASEKTFDILLARKAP